MNWKQQLLVLDAKRRGFNLITHDIQNAVENDIRHVEIGTIARLYPTHLSLIDNQRECRS